jgi:hypothetical protein
MPELRDNPHVNAPSPHAFRNKSGDSRIHLSMARKDKRALYHATMLVTRTEEWCVEASSPEEARARLEKGEGHRCTSGEVSCLEIGEML